VNGIVVVPWESEEAKAIAGIANAVLYGAATMGYGADVVTSAISLIIARLKLLCPELDVDLLIEGIAAAVRTNLVEAEKAQCQGTA